MKKNNGNMTIQDIEKACKKLGGIFLSPEDEVYKEQPSISFLSQSVRLRKLHSMKLEN